MTTALTLFCQKARNLHSNCQKEKKRIFRNLVFRELLQWTNQKHFWQFGQKYFRKLFFAVSTRKLKNVHLEVFFTRKLFFWTRKLKFWLTSWICFSRRQTNYTQSSRKKKMNLQRNKFPQGVSEYKTNTVLKSLPKILRHFFTVSTRKVIPWGFFMFALRMLFSTCKMLNWPPFLVSTKGSEDFAQCTKTVGNFRKNE